MLPFSLILNELSLWFI